MTRLRGLRRAPRLPLAVLLVAFAYFAWVVLLGTGAVALPGLEPGVRLEDWALGGVALLLVLLGVLVADAARARRAGPQAPAAPALPEGGARLWERDEVVATGETWHGLRVLEYSRPPKSEHGPAVYAKCYVPVDEAYVLRVESLVAEAPRERA